MSSPSAIALACDLNGLADALAPLLSERLQTNSERLLTRPQLAERLQCSERAITSMARRHELPEGFLIGGLRRWSWPSVLAFLESRQDRRRRVTGRGKYPRGENN